jgi:hypothetical protein
MDRPATDAIQLPPPFFCALGGKGREGRTASSLGFCAPRDSSVTLSLYSLITVVAVASLTHAFSLNDLLAQPRASEDCQKINQRRRRACQAQPCRRGKFFVLQLDIAFEALA